MPPVPPTNTPNNGGGKRPFNWSRFSKTLSFWILIVLIPVALLQFSNRGSDSAPAISYSEYSQQLDHDNISKVTVIGGRVVTGDFRAPVRVKDHDEKKFVVRLPIENWNQEMERLRAKNVDIDAKDAGQGFGAYIITFLPYLLLIGFWVFLFKQMQAGGAKAFSFGKSKAKLLTGDTPKVTFADVAGADEAKVELQEIIEFP